MIKQKNNNKNRKYQLNWLEKVNSTKSTLTEQCLLDEHQLFLIHPIAILRVMVLFFWIFDFFLEKNNFIFNWELLLRVDVNAFEGDRIPAPQQTNGVSVFAFSPSPWLPISSKCKTFLINQLNQTNNIRILMIIIRTFITHAVVGSEHIRSLTVMIEKRFDALLDTTNSFVNHSYFVQILATKRSFRVSVRVNAQQMQKQNNFVLFQSICQSFVAFCLCKQIINSFKHPFIKFGWIFFKNSLINK